MPKMKINMGDNWVSAMDRIRC